MILNKCQNFKRPQTTIDFSYRERVHQIEDKNRLAREIRRCFCLTHFRGDFIAL